MKKQIVLSLSVVVLALTTEIAYGLDLKRASQKTAQTEQEKAGNTTPRSVSPDVQKDTSAALTSAEALAGTGISLDDVALGLQKMGANPANGNAANAAKVQDFITTGQASSGSDNKSQKLGRMSKKSK